MSTAPAGPATLAWLITGSDTSLVSQELSRLVKELLAGADRSLALEDFAGAEDDNDAAVVGAVADACSTPPFLAEHRVVVLRGAGHYKTEQLEPVVSYLSSPLPTTRLVVVGGGDGGAVPAKVAAAFKQSPLAQVMSTDVGSRDVHGWVSQRVAESEVKFSAPALALLEEHLGEDLGRLSTVVGAVGAAYGRGARVGPEEIAPYLGQAGPVPPWDLTDAIDKGDTDKALKLLHRLTEAGGRHPLVVLAVLHKHFSNVLRAQSPNIANEAQAAAALGIPKGRSTFPARKALDAARRLGPEGVERAIGELADAELALKGKVDWAPELVLEVLVARLCRLSRTSGPARAP